MFAFDLWRNGLRNVYFLIASIENKSFDLLIHEIKISARPAPEAWGLAEKEWPSPPTYEPPHQLTNLDGSQKDNFIRIVVAVVDFKSINDRDVYLRV